jgi:WD40 repeat protein
MASAGDDQTAKVWDAASGKEVFTLFGHNDVLFKLAFDAGGTRLATAGADGTAKVWDAISGRELLTLSGHTG